jgi:hypothetical protein
MVRHVIGGATPHDDREQYGPVLRRAFPLGLISFEGLGLVSRTSGPAPGKMSLQQAKGSRVR